MLVAICLTLLVVVGEAFYLPGLAPTNFCFKIEEQEGVCTVSLCHHWNVS